MKTRRRKSFGLFVSSVLLLSCSLLHSLVRLDKMHTQWQCTHILELNNIVLVLFSSSQRNDNVLLHASLCLFHITFEKVHTSSYKTSKSKNNNGSKSSSSHNRMVPTIQTHTNACTLTCWMDMCACTQIHTSMCLGFGVHIFLYRELNYLGSEL